MDFHEVFMKQTFFRDIVTFNNFVGFVVAREYIDHSSQLTCSDEEKTYNFYIFFLNLLRGKEESSGIIIPSLSNPKCMHKILSRLVLARLEVLRNLEELVEYVHPSYIKAALGRQNEDELHDFSPAVCLQESFVGQFMRKFVIGFHLQSFNQMLRFSNAFYDYYDSERESNSELLAPAVDHLSVQQVTKFSEGIIRKVGHLGSLSSTKYDQLVQNLRRHQKRYPDLATPHYASHLLALRHRDFGTAEVELYKAFEMLMSERSEGPASDNSFRLKPADAWTSMTLAAVDMHHRLGHDQQARSLLQQALRQTLEMNDPICLRQVRAAHDVLNPMGGPFRYETATDDFKGSVPTDLVLTELRVKLLKLLGEGASPQTVLLVFFNSVIAPSSEALATALLDLAIIWAFYGYSIVATTLLQCVIMFDALHPCAFSDEVLSQAISHLALIFAASSSSASAVEIINVAASIIDNSLDGFSHFERARLETQIQQACRVGCDLHICERLVNNLVIFCPWETTLRLANLEFMKGNQSEAFRLLQAIADKAESLRTSVSFSDDQVEDTDDGNADDLLGMLKPPSAGGVAAVVRFEIRARLAMADILVYNRMFAQSLEQLDRALAIGSGHQLNLLTNVATIVRVAVCRLGAIRSPDDGPTEKADLMDAFSGVCHQAEPAFRKRLSNVMYWLSLSDGCLTAKKAWREALCEGAVFFANTGDLHALRNAVALCNILDDEDIGDSSSSLAELLFPLMQ